MSDHVKCKICGEWGWINSHKCAPVWEARMYDPKWDQEWSEVYAYDEGAAAEKFAEEYDHNGEYDIVRRGSAEIEVRRPGEDAITLVDISAESVPEYYGYVRTPKGVEAQTVSDDCSAVDQQSEAR
jgi:hypothetical protein